MTGRSGPFDIHEAADIIRQITGDRLVLVGGQAVNYWAEQYRVEDPAFETLAPFTSADIDFLGRADAVNEIARRFNGTAKFANWDHQNTPEIAVIEGTYNGKPLRIDFLGSVLGPSNADIRRSAVKVTENATGTSFLALHPLHVLECRISNVAGPLKRQDEQSIRQLRAALRITRNYVRHTAIDADAGPRKALNQIERVFEIATDDQAHFVKARYHIDLMDAVPQEIFPHLPPQFSSIRWPQMVERHLSGYEAFLTATNIIPLPPRGITPHTNLDPTRQASREIAEFSGLTHKREALQKNLVKLVQDLSQADRALLTTQENQMIDRAVQRGKGLGR